MTDAEVERLGERYRKWRDEATALRYELADAVDAVNAGEVDPGFGRDLIAALGAVESVP